MHLNGKEITMLSNEASKSFLGVIGVASVIQLINSFNGGD